MCFQIQSDKWLFLKNGLNQKFQLSIHLVRLHPSLDLYNTHLMDHTKQSNNQYTTRHRHTGLTTEKRLTVFEKCFVQSNMKHHTCIFFWNYMSSPSGDILFSSCQQSVSIKILYMFANHSTFSMEIHQMHTYLLLLKINLSLRQFETASMA